MHVCIKYVPKFVPPSPSETRWLSISTDDVFVIETNPKKCVRLLPTTSPQKPVLCMLCPQRLPLFTFGRHESLTLSILPAVQSLQTTQRWFPYTVFVRQHFSPHDCFFFHFFPLSFLLRVRNAQKFPKGYWEVF